MNKSQTDATCKGVSFVWMIMISYMMYDLYQKQQLILLTDTAIILHSLSAFIQLPL